jgi:hypothetical protein|tara:strand:+ start:569 stop:913 length:345 start_codon:yes stop_codon:yes gene_type:complete
MTREYEEFRVGRFSGDLKIMMEFYTNDYLYASLNGLEGCGTIEINNGGSYTVFIGRDIESGLVLARVGGEDEKITREIMRRFGVEMPIELSKDPKAEDILKFRSIVRGTDPINN